MRTRSPAPAPAPAPAPPPSPISRARPPKAGTDAWDARRRSPDAGEHEIDPRTSPTALLQKILEAAIRARYVPPRALGRSTRRAGRGAGGCLRLLLGMVLVLLALASGAFVFGRTLLLGF